MKLMMIIKGVDEVYNIQFSLSSKQAIKEMNGFKFEQINNNNYENKQIAVDYTLPKDVYSKIQKQWTEYKYKQKQKEKENAKNKKEKSVWKLYKFMNDYEEKTFYKKSKKELSFRESIDIPLSSEPTDYDWNKWFLGYRLNIIEYDTNCRIMLNINKDNNDNDNISIFSDNQHSLENKKIINEILNDKTIREIGYTQIMKVPFELEHNDFDWILYLNGENYEKRKEFQLNTGCSFLFKVKLSSYFVGNKADLLKIQLVASTRKSLERGVNLMKNNFLSTDKKKQRQNEMKFKYIRRIYFPTNKDIDYIALIKSPNGQRLKTMEKMTKCRIRIFGSLKFVNKNIKSYCKILAKNENDLKNGYKEIHRLIFDDETRNNAINENYQMLNKNKSNNNNNNDNKKKSSFWFYSGDANEGRTIFVRNRHLLSLKTIRDKFAEFAI